MSVVESDNTYAINAVAYDSRKYAFVEEDVEFAPRSVSLLNEPPAAPTNIDVREVLYESGGRVLQKLNYWLAGQSSCN